MKIIQLGPTSFGQFQPEVVVLCEDHNTTFPIPDFSLYDGPPSILELELYARKILDEQCLGCVAARTPSRWPNAGENGGAEL